MRYAEGEKEKVAEAILLLVTPSLERATVIALSGDLGAGKTTLTQALAKQMGVTETVTSPTFVIMKEYIPLSSPFRALVHLDAYRIEDEVELTPLRFAEKLRTPETLIVIEWPERISGVLPKQHTRIHLTHDGDMRQMTHFSHHA